MTMGGCHDHYAKVTIMLLHVDLGCSHCYKKVKNILCKIPEIQDQLFDEKQNTVTIGVVCCSPEKIRDMLYCKGGKCIKCIAIPELKQPQPPLPKPLPRPPQPVNPNPTHEQPPAPPTEQKPPKNPKPDEKCPPCLPPPVQPVPTCCGPCSAGIPGGPCYHQSYGSGPSCGYSYGYEPRYCRCEPRYCRCDCYKDENQAPCSIM